MTNPPPRQPPAPDWTPPAGLVEKAQTAANKEAWQADEYCSERMAAAALRVSGLGDAMRLLERAATELEAMAARARHQEHWEIQPDGHAQDLEGAEAVARDIRALLDRLNAKGERDA
jgi:hypothetical protein